MPHVITPGQEGTHVPTSLDNLETHIGEEPIPSGIPQEPPVIPNPHSHSKIPSAPNTNPHLDAFQTQDCDIDHDKLNDGPPDAQFNSVMDVDSENGWGHPTPELGMQFVHRSLHSSH
jgi:hypothetical protein